MRGLTRFPGGGGKGASCLEDMLLYVECGCYLSGASRGARVLRHSLSGRLFGLSKVQGPDRRGWLESRRLPRVPALSSKLFSGRRGVHARLATAPATPLHAQMRYYPSSRSRKVEQQCQGVAEVLLGVCQRRYFLRGGEEPQEPTWDSYLRGGHPGFGTLGVALRKNLAAQWWESVVVFREQVLAVDAPLHRSPNAGGALPGAACRVVQPAALWDVLRAGELSAEQKLASLEKMLEASGMLRDSLLRGMLFRCLQKAEAATLRFRPN